jgi:hypothetical protein
MNNLEQRMVSLLNNLKNNHGVIGVKAEFEAEGTRLEEALRLKEVVTQANLDLTIKVGGCEALKDMFDAKSIGVTQIVGPMIESAYALKKFIKACKICYVGEEQYHVNFLINIETKLGINNIESILYSPEVEDLDGVTLGRVDLIGSLGRERTYVNSDEIMSYAKKAFSLCKRKGILCTIGGGIDKDSIPFIRELFVEGLLHRYETRKVIFDCDVALRNKPEEGLLKAVSFELMWLKNKCNFYKSILDEDSTRLQMLEKRYNCLLEKIGYLA